MALARTCRRRRSKRHQASDISAAQQGSVSANVNAIAPTPKPAPPKRAAYYLWAALIARIYEVFPLLCPLCGGQMRIIAFITHSADIRNIMEHIGVACEPPQISPARGPPLWESCDAVAGAYVTEFGTEKGMTT